MVALADLVANQALGLEVVACPDVATGRDVQAAAVSELPEPGQWLQGGELLMTIGLLLPMTGEACDSYLGNLAGAGVSALALGLGAGLPYQAAPAALVAAAERARIPLLTVPDGVPFIAVTKAVFALQAAQERAELEWALQAQRSLTDAAVQPGGLDAILAAHHRVSECAGAIVDPVGRVLAAGGRAGDELARGMADLVDSIRDRGLGAAAVDSAGELRREVHPLGSRRLRGWLLLDGRADRTTSHLVTAGLVSLLSLEIERRHALDSAERRRRSQVFERLVRPGIDDVAAGRMLASIGLVDEPRRCVALEAGPGESDVAELAGDLAGVLADTLARTAGGVVELCVPASIDVQRVLPRLAPGRPTGIGGQVSAASLAVSLRQARSALAASRLVGHPVSSDDLAGRDALAMLPGEVLLAYADAVLAPLDTADRGPDLVAALDAYLTANGSWEATAAALHVHRHTVRNRIARIESLTGRSLDNAQNRLELGLALHSRSRR